MAPPTNLIQIVLNGGFPAATAANPRPFGMPPFVLTLDDAQTSAVLSYIRGAWGNAAPPVAQIEVQRLRGQGGR
jgi:mono/diheme cytochrome c family protein